MSQHCNRFLVKSLLDVILFIEFSDQEHLDEDHGVELLEKIAYNFSLMEESCRQEISNIFLDFAEEYSSKESEFIRSLPDSLGLT